MCLNLIRSTNLKVPPATTSKTPNLLFMIILYLLLWEISIYHPFYKKTDEHMTTLNHKNDKAEAGSPVYNYIITKIQNLQPLGESPKPALLPNTSVLHLIKIYHIQIKMAMRTSTLPTR